MMVISGLVIVFNLVLSAMVGTRLLRLPATSWRSPERWLAGYFLVGALVGGILVTIAYAAWADPALGIPPGWITPLNAFGVLATHLGGAGVYIFTWLTFRRAQTWARSLALLCIATLAVAYILELLVAGFTIQIVTHPIHWIGFAARVGGFLWVAVESFHYYSRLRKQMRLGLADPLLTNRFLLWGVWSATAFVMAQSEVLARLAYHQVVGTAEVQSVAQPIIVATITMTSVLGSICAAMLFLTFFASGSYRRWVMNRSASVQA